MFITELMLAKKKILCYNIGIERKRENIMKKTVKTTTEEVTVKAPLLKPFPFIINKAD